LLITLKLILNISFQIGPRKYGGVRSEEIFRLLAPASLLPVNMNNDTIPSYLCAFLSAALAKSTWKKYNSAWKKFIKFCMYSGSECKLPPSIENVRAFVIWCLAVEKLKPDTVKSYLTGLSMANILSSNVNQNFMSDKIIAMCLTGAENFSPYMPQKFSNRRSVSLDGLKVLGHRIASSNWEEDSKIVIWAACTMAFFTCSRMGELLADSASYTDKIRPCAGKMLNFTIAVIY